MCVGSLLLFLDSVTESADTTHRLMSDGSSSDSEAEFLTPSKTLKEAINSCLNMKPEASASMGSVKQRMNRLKQKLDKNKTTDASKTRKSVRNLNKLDSVQKDIHSDFEKLMNKFDSMFELLSDVFEEFELLECRVTKLETNSTMTYSQVTSLPSTVKSTNEEGSEDRMEKLEYSLSEDERKKRQLQV